MPNQRFHHRILVTLILYLMPGGDEFDGAGDTGSGENGG